MKTIIIISIFLMLITSCATSPTPASANIVASTPSDSGIEGQALISPTCAGPVRIGSSCDEEPYQATLTVLSPKGERIVQIQTDEKGRFKISLAPGEYILHPESEDITSAEEQTVIVEAGAFTQVVVNYDSGIR